MSERIMCKSVDRDSVNNFPCFELQGSWSDGYKSAKVDSHGVVVGPGQSQPNVFAQSFVAEPGSQYKVSAAAASLTKNAVPAMTQINWTAKDGSFIAVSQSRFQAENTLTQHSSIIVTPPNAANGTLYVVPGSTQSVRYTEMSLVKLGPVSDFFSYRFVGVSGLEGTAIFTGILLLGACGYFLRRRSARLASR